MSTVGPGVIASRTLGILLLALGLIAAADACFVQWSLSRPLPQEGWSNFAPLEDSSASLHLHDSYTVVDTRFFSPFGMGLLILTGLFFLLFSKPVGRLIEKP